MASRKAPAARKPAAKKPAGKSAPSKSGARKSGFPFANLLLVPLALAGGGYLGVQAYAAYRHETGALSWQSLLARADARAPGTKVTADEDAPPPSRRRKQSRRDPDAADEPRRDAQGRTQAKASDEHDHDHPTAGVSERDGDPGGSADGGVRITPAADPRAPEPAPAADAGGSLSPTRSTPPPGIPDARPGAPEVTPPSPERPVPSAPTSPDSTRASAGIRPLPAREVSRGSARKAQVALTFDAGSDYRPVRKILDALAQENLRCTFFLTGEWVQRNPATSRLIVQAGHEIGNHSWDHPAFTRLSPDAIRDQLRRTEEVIQSTLGRSSRPFFRPPLGDRDPRVLDLVGSEGYQTVYWSLDSRDSVDKGITAQQIRDRVLSKVGPGSIVLMHCGSQPTADALTEILAGLKARGLTPVTVGRLLAD